MSKYGLKEFKELIEKAYESTKDPLSVPFGMDPHSHEAHKLRFARAECYNYVLEMMPEIDNV